MEVDHALAAGGLVKPVHILRQEDLGFSALFEARQSPMGVVRQGPAEPSPSDHASRPIASARFLVTHKSLIGDGLLTLPVSIRIAVVGNAGIRAATGSGQNEKPAMPVEEILE